MPIERGGHDAGLSGDFTQAQRREALVLEQAQCGGDEIMVSAMCVGGPVIATVTDNGASCEGPAGAALKARLVCAKK